jgi:hypothetical protein
MNKGVIFFIVIVLAVLAIIFIPKNKDGVPAEDTTTAGMTQEDLQGSVIESQTEADMNTSAELPSMDSSAEGVVEVTATETTPAVTE